MEEEIQDVNPVESSTTETQDVNKEVQETIQPEQTVEPEATSPAPESGNTQQEDVDELGVPYKNRYMEEKRKREKESSELSEIKEILKTQVSQQQQKTYTLEELEAFERATDNESHAQWARNEAHKLREAELEKKVKDEFKKMSEAQKVESIKANSFNDVLHRNPNIFIRDSRGNFSGWNTNDPLCQSIQKYMSNPRIANQPDAILVAEKFAKADLYQMQQPVVRQKISDQANQLKNLQKKTLVEGAGQTQQGQISPTAAAIQKGLTGKVEDNTEAMNSILKRSGVIK